MCGNTLRVAAGASLDYETATSHQVTISAIDPAGLAYTQVVTISVTNVVGVTITGSNAADTINGTQTVAGQAFSTNEEDTIFGRGGNDSFDDGSALGLLKICEFACRAERG